MGFVERTGVLRVQRKVLKQPVSTAHRRYNTRSRKRAHCTLHTSSAPAKHISEGAAPCPYSALLPCALPELPCVLPDLHSALTNCTMLADLCPCFYRSPKKLRSDLVLFALALNCALILVVRTLDCAQFLLHPAFFPTRLEH